MPAPQDWAEMLSLALPSQYGHIDLSSFPAFHQYLFCLVLGASDLVYQNPSGLGLWEHLCLVSIQEKLKSHKNLKIDMS